MSEAGHITVDPCKLPDADPHAVPEAPRPRRKLSADQKRRAKQKRKAQRKARKR